jgi:hypothetical protein
VCASDHTLFFGAGQIHCIKRCRKRLPMQATAFLCTCKVACAELFGETKLLGFLNQKRRAQVGTFRDIESAERSR